jgi:hypothetical protein
VEVLRLWLACPVPVGHRVTVRWYLAAKRGVGPLVQRPHEPIVDDHDTGIRHTPGWALHASGDTHARELSELGEDPSLRLERSITGRVLACTVVTMPANHRHPVQTRLVIEPDAPQPPYR